MLFLPILRPLYFLIIPILCFRTCNSVFALLLPAFLQMPCDAPFPLYLFPITSGFFLFILVLPFPLISFTTFVLSASNQFHAFPPFPQLSSSLSLHHVHSHTPLTRSQPLANLINFRPADSTTIYKIELLIVDAFFKVETCNLCFLLHPRNRPLHASRVCNVIFCQQLYSFRSVHCRNIYVHVFL